ncbi:hypothetical protein EDB92DRAFT_2027166 [Lactarius akahatsu]|uniref:DUF7223 domain-containing protein n=1 Tax=Lactarius akahatsu TaxID=416441 RepID=A0AAD4LCC3_9AGAM|nr:hypothetical protein EDB92DRAFT_2027166 [Lactarius akahatsu]
MQVAVMPFSTKSSMLFYLAALALTAGSRQRVLAANDWLVPCTQGRCSWDLPADSGASGTLQIWGPATAISDITPAAGWRIITRCDPAATAQDIQLECADGNPDCDHLFQGGAVDTIVRLARQSTVWRSTRIFAAATPPRNGTVSFTLQGLNVEGSNGASALTTPASAHQRSWFSRRGLHGSLRHIHRRSFVGDVLQTLQNVTTFNKTITQDLQPVDFNGAKNLFKTSVDCAASTAIPVSSTASLSLDVDAAVHAVVSLGAVAAGTLVPPKIYEFGLTLGLDGNIDALFSITANLTGHVSSGTVPLFQIGIPGLSFPGILEIGPEFKVTGEVDVDLALTNVDTDVRITYNLSDVAAIFPPQHCKTGGAFKQGPSEVSISAGPDITDAGASVSVTGHLIPQIDIGLSALGGIASTTVFLNLDASASLTVSADADGSRGDKTAAPAGGAQACVDANTELAVNVGAQASFFDLFNASTGTTLFDKSFPLLQQKCVGVSNSISVPSKQPVARRSHALRAPLDGYDTDKSNSSITSRDLDLGCPLTLATQVSQLVKAIIPAT